MISRRALLEGLTATATGSAFAARLSPAAAEPPPETTRLRLSQIAGICVAPQYVAQGLLKLEAFTDVQYVTLKETNPYPAFIPGDIDVSMAFVAPFLVQLDAGLPVVLLAGVHAGCFELFGTERVRAIRDLEGMTVGVPSLGSPHHLFLSTMAAYVGLDPRQRSRRTRSSWSGTRWRRSGRSGPSSRRRTCARSSRSGPRGVIVERGFTKNLDHAVATMKEVPDNRWREYDPADTVRFYSLRLREIGAIKNTPQKLMADGTDWRFFNELKRELKG